MHLAWLLGFSDIPPGLSEVAIGFFSDLNKVIVCLWAFDLNRFSSFYDGDNTPKLASSTEASVYIILAPGTNVLRVEVSVSLSKSVQLKVQYFE